MSLISSSPSLVVDD